MSDSYSDEYTQEAAPQASQADKDVEYWKAEAQKAFEARDTARTELRNQIQAGYDPEVVELVSPDLPPTKWKEQADKLVAFRGKAAPVTPEPSNEEPPPEVEVPEETLAGIVNGPSGSASGSSNVISHADWLKMIDDGDTAEAERLFKADKVNMTDLRKGLGPDR